MLSVLGLLALHGHVVVGDAAYYREAGDEGVWIFSMFSSKGVDVFGFDSHLGTELFVSIHHPDGGVVFDGVGFYGVEGFAETRDRVAFGIGNHACGIESRSGSEPSTDGAGGTAYDSIGEGLLTGGFDFGGVGLVTGENFAGAVVYGGVVGHGRCFLVRASMQSALPG